MPKAHDDTEQEFLAAYDEYADAIFRHCALRLGDRELGKDMMQDTFMRAWESVAKGTTVTHMRAFLYKIANNLIIDTARRRKIHIQESLEELQEETGFDVPDKEPGPVRQLEGTLVLETLQRLEEPYRTAVIMRFVDDLEPREIARMLDVSADAVSVRIHRGIRRLSTFLSPNPRTTPDTDA